MSGDASGKSSESASDWRSFPPFYAHLDLQLRELGNGRCVIDLPYAKHFGNSRGEVHGGIAASVLDIALSQAVRSTLDGPTNVATISMTVSYFAPAKGVLTCTGAVVRRGGTVAFAEGEIIGEDGKLASRAVATYRILKPLKSS